MADKSTQLKKPQVPHIPEKVSELENDAQYLDAPAAQAMIDNKAVGYYTKAETDEKDTAIKNEFREMDETLRNALTHKQDTLSDSQMRAVNSGITAEDLSHLVDVETTIYKLEGWVMPDTTRNNQLANKDFVNSSIANATARYLTRRPNGDAFATKAELDAQQVFYYAGEEVQPGKNDYVTVLADETRDGAQTRYVAQLNEGNLVWAFQYKVNDKPFTAAQNAAINSGLSSADKTKLDGIENGAQRNVAPTWDTVEDKPTFAAVATSGEYTDIQHRPNFYFDEATLTLEITYDAED